MLQEELHMSDMGDELPINRGHGEVFVEYDDFGRETPISAKLYQAIYNQITGKTERLGQVIHLVAVTTGSALGQLHTKIAQVLSQYNVIAKSNSVSVYHQNASRELFSSFERFRTYDPSKLEPVSRLVLKYNFSILLPDLQRPQNYALTVQINSGLSNFLDNSEKFPFDFAASYLLRYHHDFVINIDYVDYIVARNVLDTVTNWTKSNETNEPGKLHKFLEKHEGLISDAFRYLMIGAIFIITMLNVPSAIRWLGGNATAIVISTVSSIGVLYAFLRIGQRLGSIVEVEMLLRTELSRIELNEGDKKQYTRYCGKHKRSVLKVVGSFCTGIALNVVAAIVYKLLFH